MGKRGAEVAERQADQPPSGEAAADEHHGQGSGDLAGGAGQDVIARPVAVCLAEDGGPGGGVEDGRLRVARDELVPRRAGARVDDLDGGHAYTSRGRRRKSTRG